MVRLPRAGIVKRIGIRISHVHQKSSIIIKEISIVAHDMSRGSSDKSMSMAVRQLSSSIQLLCEYLEKEIEEDE